MDKIVLCSSPFKAAKLPPAEMIGEAYSNLLKGGTRAIIFAQYLFNTVSNIGGADTNMPCVLVDFEIAHRIASYSRSTRWVTHSLGQIWMSHFLKFYVSIV